MQYKIKSFVYNIFNCILLPNIWVARCCIIVINIILPSILTAACAHIAHIRLWTQRSSSLLSEKCPLKMTWLIDLHWVRALTVLMHLGLVDGPFVPHNLISAQESPVPVSKFQMAPRLKILMSSGFKKGTQIYYPFLSKSPGKWIPSRFPNGSPMERDTWIQGIFTFLLIYLFISKPLTKECPSMFPKHRASMETDAHSRSLTYLSGSPVKEPPPRSPLQSPIGERCLVPRALHLSFEVPSIWAPLLIPGSPWT